MPEHRRREFERARDQVGGAKIMVVTWPLFSGVLIGCSRLLVGSCCTSNPHFAGSPLRIGLTGFAAVSRRIICVARTARWARRVRPTCSTETTNTAASSAAAVATAAHAAHAAAASTAVRSVVLVARPAAEPAAPTSGAARGAANGADCDAAGSPPTRPSLARLVYSHSTLSCQYGFTVYTSCARATCVHTARTCKDASALSVVSF